MIRVRFLFLFLSFFACTAIIQAQMTVALARSVNQMALVSEGHFTMGSNNRPEDEKPEHRVFVRSFSIDVLPVSNADFAKFLNARSLKNVLGESFYDDHDRDARIHQQNSLWQADVGYATHPVNEVSWVGARDYCNWLN
jgi:formylglycine-generating enzyme required for sulfatase activity